jgi:DNA-directed RNA polymerase specialized sigma24 family protein
MLMKGFLPKTEHEPPGPAAHAVVVEKETDASLVRLMAQQAGRPELAEDAVAELYRRHARRMTAACIKAFALYHQHHEELVRLAFEKALRDAPRKATQLRRDLSDESHATHIKCWLYCILKRTCLDARRGEASERAERSDQDVTSVPAVAFDPPDAEPTQPPEPRWMQLVRDFISSCSDRDQKILYNTIQFRDRITGQTSVPQDILDVLLKETKMKEGALRTRRLRLMDRMVQYVHRNL